MNLGSTKSETRRSFLLSVALHLTILLLLIFNGGTERKSAGSKLTEVSFMERYGPDVASKIVRRRIPIRTHSLLKRLFSPRKRGGEGKSAAARQGEQSPGLQGESKPINKDIITSIPQKMEDLIDVDQKVRVSSQPKRSVIAQGRLVGRKAKANLADLPFKVEENLPKLVNADIEMVVKIPVGGLESGDKHFVGGILTKGKKDLVEPVVPPPASPGDIVDIPGGGGDRGRGTLLDYGETGSAGGGGSSGSGGGKSAMTIPPTKRLQMLSEEVGNQVALKSKEKGKEGPPKSGHGVTMRLSGPLSGRKILKSFAPDYPEWARRKGIEGRVDLHLTVDPNGFVKDNVYVEKTSGQPGLDRVAIAAVKRWVFVPLSPDVAQIEQWGIVTIFFRLE